MCEMKDVFVLILLILCSVSDLRRRGVYTWILVAMSMLLLLFCVLHHQREISSIAGGVLVGGLFLLTSRWSKEAIGYADSWLILLLGGYLGMGRVLMLVTVAFFLAGIASLVGYISRRVKKSSTIPFIPFLTVAYVGVVFL